MCLFTHSAYFISCSVSSNNGLSKNVRTVIPSPSQSFLMETTPIYRKVPGFVL